MSFVPSWAMTALRCRLVVLFVDIVAQQQLTGIKHGEKGETDSQVDVWASEVIILKNRTR